jgi:hypothetical protein
MFYVCKLVINKIKIANNLNWWYTITNK